MIKKTFDQYIISSVNIIIFCCLCYTLCIHSDTSELDYQSQPDTGLAGFQVLMSPRLIYKLQDIPVKVEPYGYVKTDIFYDTRQVKGIAADEISVVPEPFCADKCNRDINSRGQFNCTTLQSRIGFLLNSPLSQDGRVTASGRVEGTFRGVSEDTTSILSGHLIYGTIVWDDSYSLLFGQFFDPLFVLECYPHTLNFDVILAVEISSLNPQIRYTQEFGNITCALTALSQSFLVSDGPCGWSSKYIRNSLVPNFNFLMKYSFGDSDQHITGFSIDYKRLLPRLVTNKCIKTDSTNNSIIAEAFLALNFTNLYLRSKLFYSQNGTEHTLLGGYGVLTRDPETDVRTYGNIPAIGGWFDVSYIKLNRQMEIGGFIGYTQRVSTDCNFYINLETKSPITYGFFRCLDSVLRIAPRVIWARDSIRFGFEVWYDRGVYGKLNKQADLVNLIPVSNYRLSASIIYLF